MSKQTYVTLNNGIQMPMAGIGTFLLSPDDAELAVISALQMGISLLIRPTPMSMRRHFVPPVDE